MKRINNKIPKFTILLLLTLSACSKNEITSDAFGNFDIDETIIAAQASGELLQFNISEGQALKKGDVIGYIDSTSLVLERTSIGANKNAVSAQLASINAEINVLKVQLKVIEKERTRVLNLMKSDAATAKQLDDVEGNIDVLKSKIEAAKAKKPAVLAQLTVIQANIAKVENMIDKCTIRNPQDGLVLTKLAEAHEIVAPGKPLYKLANINNVYLKAFVSGAQVSGLKIGQQVTIIIDDTNNSKLKELPGTIKWISSEAEFTPKIIQTRDERVALVYAIKIGVDNDGTIKIGMPGEVRF